MKSKIDDFKTFISEIIQEHPNSRLYATSSFQTQSVPLLHLISQYFKDEIEVLFIDTGYLFPETYKFALELKSTFNLKIKTLQSNTSYDLQVDAKNQPLYATNPTKCCFINKVEPIQSFLQVGDVWISGVRKDQTSFRQSLTCYEVDSNGVVRVYPMLEWDSKDVYSYIKQYNLPKHPLENEGYKSIGCVPCTSNFNELGQRSGRWEGQSKQECGLHTNK